MPRTSRGAARRALRPTALLGDERLAAMAGDGDEDAFAAIYSRYQARLHRYCLSILHDHGDAEDAVQSAMASAAAALAQRRRDAPLRPWLYRIAHNAAVTALRRRRPEVGSAVEDARTDAGVEARVEERQAIRVLVADLADLPERHRGALVMRELSGLSHAEIASAFGVSVGAAKQLIFEARRGLLERQEGRAMSCEDAQRSISDGDRRVLRSRRVRAHLAACARCSAFAEAIPARTAALNALTPPLLAVGAAGLLRRLIGGGRAGGAASGAAAKPVVGALAAKTVLGVAVATTAAVSLAGVLGAHAPAPAPRLRAAGGRDRALRASASTPSDRHPASGSLRGGRVSPSSPRIGRAPRASRPAARAIRRPPPPSLAARTGSSGAARTGGGPAPRAALPPPALAGGAVTATRGHSRRTTASHTPHVRGGSHGGGSAARSSARARSPGRTRVPPARRRGRPSSASHAGPRHRRSGETAVAVGATGAQGPTARHARQHRAPGGGGPAAPRRSGSTPATGASGTTGGTPATVGATGATGASGPPAPSPHAHGRA